MFLILVSFENSLFQNGTIINKKVLSFIDRKALRVVYSVHKGDRVNGTPLES
jgi:hypothetical protein